MSVWEGYGGTGEKAPHTPKYLEQFLMVLLATFITGLIFARQLKQGVAILCFDCNYTYS